MFAEPPAADQLGPLGGNRGRTRARLLACCRASAVKSAGVLRLVELSGGVSPLVPFSAMSFCLSRCIDSSFKAFWILPRSLCSVSWAPPSVSPGTPPLPLRSPLAMVAGGVTEELAPALQIPASVLEPCHCSECPRNRGGGLSGLHFSEAGLWPSISAALAGAAASAESDGSAGQASLVEPGLGALEEDEAPAGEKADAMPGLENSFACGAAPTAGPLAMGGPEEEAAATADAIAADTEDEKRGCGLTFIGRCVVEPAAAPPRVAARGTPLLSNMGGGRVGGGGGCG